MTFLDIAAIGACTVFAVLIYVAGIVSGILLTTGSLSLDALERRERDE